MRCVERNPFSGQHNMAKKYVGSFPNPGCRGPVRELWYPDTPEGHERAEAFAQRENIPGRAVYDAINLFRDDARVRNKETVELISKISIDIDMKDIEESKEEVIRTLTSLPYPPSEVRQSGHGIHADFLLREPVPVADSDEADKTRALRAHLMQWLCGDTSIDHDAALLRRPRTTNSKDKSNPIECAVVAACGVTYDPDDLKDLLDECGAKPLFTAKAKSEEGPAFKRGNGKSREWTGPVDIDAAFASIVDGGTCNEAQPSILASLLMRGNTPDEAIKQTVDGTMEAAERHNLGWDREYETLVVRKRCYSALGFLQDNHNWSDTGEIPPWMLPELQDDWVKGVADGCRVRVCNNGATKLHVRTWDKAKDDDNATTEKGTQRPDEPLPHNVAQLRASHAGKEETGRRPRVILKPYVFIDPKGLPPRRWLYAGHLQRRVVSADVAPGGVGKTSKALVESIALATARNLLGEQPPERCRVWVHNGEDSLEELKRRVLAICEYYNIDQKELEGWLFLTSGTEMPLKVANGYNELKIDAVLVHEITQTVLDHQIDLFVADPLVTLHGVPESDNGKMDQVIRVFTKIADTCNCSILLTHHTRKLYGGETAHSTDDARGASAIRDAVRSMRVLNVMSESEAQKLGIDEFERLLYFRVDQGKNNTRPPAKKASWYKLESIVLANGDDVGVVATWECPTDASPEINRKAENVFLAILDRLTLAGRYVNDASGMGYAPNAFAKEPEAKRAKVGKGALVEAMHRLFMYGVIRIEDHVNQSRHPTRRIVRATPPTAPTE
jgi:hypothetical protein